MSKLTNLNEGHLLNTKVNIILKFLQNKSYWKEREDGQFRESKRFRVQSTPPNTVPL
jgi:hypothetical protein